MQFTSSLAGVFGRLRERRNGLCTQMYNR